MDADGGYDNLSSISSSSDKQRKLIVKIEMAKYAKRQNDARRREEEEKAAFERKLAEAEDLRKIQFAEVEAALWERAKTPSEQDKKSVVAYPQENFPILPTPQDHLGCSNLPCPPLAEPGLSPQRLTPSVEPNDVQLSNPRFHPPISVNPPDDHYQPPPPENGFGHHFQPLPQVNSFGAYPQMTPAPNTFEPCPSHSRRHNVNYYEPRSDIREQLLPKPDVKKFDGDPLDYLAFRNRFKAHIADWLPKDKKLSYLLQHCNQKVA